MGFFNLDLKDRDVVINSYLKYKDEHGYYVVTTYKYKDAVEDQMVYGIRYEDEYTYWNFKTISELGRDKID